MFKIRCESCTRLILSNPVKEGDHQFCADGCREGWKRAMRRFKAEQAKPLTVGDP